MNNKGFGIKEICIFLFVIFICMFIVSTLYSKTVKDFDKKEGSYHDLADKLISAAHVYTDNYLDDELENGQEGYVSSSVLEKKELLDDLTDVTNKSKKCKGYVHYYRENDKTTYEAYLNCPGNYKTDNYDSSRD